MRDLHLYVGLAASPFVLVYAVSTVALNHPTWLAATDSEPAVRTAAVFLQNPEEADSLALGREVLRQTGVVGEIMFVRREPKERRLEIPVQLAGQKTTIRVDLAAGQAIIERQRHSLIASLTYFHKMPGPHVVAMRGNSLPVALWRWIADVAVCAILFLAATGVYLWTALRAERRIGVVSLVGGAAVFTLLVVGMVL
jgi:hypothetical protein